MLPRDCEDVDPLVPGDVWKGETAAVSELPLPDQPGVGGRDREPQAPRDHRSGPESGHGKPVRGVLSAGTRLHRDGVHTPGRLSFGNQRTRPDSIFHVVGVRSRVREAATGRSGVIAESVPNRTLSGIEERGAEISQGRNVLFERFGRPDVVAVEADALPAERSDVGREACREVFRLGREARLCRQYRHSASRPLCYLFKGHVAHQGGPQTGRRTLYRDTKHGIPEPLKYDLEQILR
jgi:hypothetical protein